jgi:ferredoxin-nitrate reductase
MPIPKHADLLLPAAGWLEKGTMTNSDRRISYLPKGINALEKHSGCGNPLFATKNEFQRFQFQ